MISDNYVAAFLDAEGSIRIRERTKKGRARYTETRVIISNSHLGVLEMICEKFGGKIYKNKRIVNLAVWTIEWYSQDDIVFLLTALIPHMIIKADKARAILDHIEDKKIRQMDKHEYQSNLSSRTIRCE